MPFGRSVSAKNSARRSDPIGCGRGRLHDDGRADRERRRHLMGDQVQGEVEGRDAEHRPDREPADQTDARSERRLRVQAHQLVVAAADRLGRPTERGDRTGRLRLRPLERLAALARDQLGVLVDGFGRDVARCGRDRRPVRGPAGAGTPRRSPPRWRRPPRRRGGGTPTSATTLSSYGLVTSNDPSPVRHSPFTKNGRTAMFGSPPSAARGARAGAARTATSLFQTTSQSSDTITCLMFV